MKTFKTAVIGCGMISKNHFKALKNVENAECVVACDIRPERAAAAAETYGIPHTETEYHRVLDNPEIDVVHICLPHYLHAQVAIEAMEHGKRYSTRLLWLLHCPSSVFIRSFRSTLSRVL